MDIEQGTFICPFCGYDEVNFVDEDFQATAIYCMNCPCGLEDDTLTLDELKEHWLDQQRFWKDRSRVA